MRSLIRRCGCAVGMRARIARRQLLEVASARFASTGTWPTVEDVRRRLSASGLALDPVGSLPRALGHVDSEGRVVLSLRGLRRIAATADIVDDFMKALRLAASRYREFEADPELSIDELAAELSLSPLRARQAMALLESEGLVRPLNGAGKAIVTSEIVPCAAARSSRKYVRKRTATQPRPRSVPCLSGVRSWLGAREHTTRDLIAIAFLGALMYYGATTAIPDVFDGQPPDRSGKQPPTKVSHGPQSDRHSKRRGRSPGHG